MLTAPQLRAARALLGLDQRRLAEAAGLSLPTIQRMEASDGLIRGHVDSLMKLVEALNRAGIELIGDGAASFGGGRGVRLRPADVASADVSAGHRRGLAAPTPAGEGGRGFELGLGPHPRA